MTSPFLVDQMMTPRSSRGARRGGGGVAVGVVGATPPVVWQCAWGAWLVVMVLCAGGAGVGALPSSKLSEACIMAFF